MDIYTTGYSVNQNSDASITAFKSNLRKCQEKTLTLLNCRTNEKIIIDKFPAILGKNSEKCDFRISNKAVSRKHVQIVLMFNEFYIEDLNSKNGTYINGKQIIPSKKIRIERGYIIQLANEKFIFEE